MDKSNLDLSLVARLGSHSAPRNPSGQGAVPRHDHHLCPDSDGGESCRKDQQSEDQSTCYGVDCEWRIGHWLHLREGRSYVQGVLTCDFRQRRLQCGFHQQLAACTVPPSQALEQLIDVLEKPKDRFFCTPDRAQYRIRSPRLAASFQMVLTRCEFCPVALNVKVMKFKHQPFSSNCFSPVFRHGKWQAVVGRHGSSSESLDEHWIATASYRSADGRRAADAAQLQCPLEKGLPGREAQQSPWCSVEADETR